jgi:hypothetical protein
MVAFLSFVYLDVGRLGRGRYVNSRMAVAMRNYVPWAQTRDLLTGRRNLSRCQDWS